MVVKRSFRRYAEAIRPEWGERPTTYAVPPSRKTSFNAGWRREYRCIHSGKGGGGRKFDSWRKATGSEPPLASHERGRGHCRGRLPPLREREPERRLPLLAPLCQAVRDCTDASYLCTSTGPADQSSRAWMLTVGLLGPSAGLLPMEGTDVM